MVYNSFQNGINVSIPACPAFWLIPNFSTDFGKAQPPNAKGVVNYAIEGSLLGIISASYNLGAITAVPVVPWVANKYGRRWSIFLGSAFQCMGAIIQCFSQHGRY